MAAYLKHNDKQLYLKSIDKDNDKLEFTESVSEAKPYDNDWFAKAELEFLQFHYPDYKEEYLNHLVPWYQ